MTRKKFVGMKKSEAPTPVKAALNAAGMRLDNLPHVTVDAADKTGHMKKIHVWCDSIVTLFTFIGKEATAFEGNLNNVSRSERIMTIVLEANDCMMADSMCKPEHQGKYRITDDGKLEVIEWLRVRGCAFIIPPGYPEKEKGIRLAATWKRDDDSALLALAKSAVLGVDEIARVLGRAPRAVDCRLKRHHVTPKAGWRKKESKGELHPDHNSNHSKPRIWSHDEDDVLLRACLSSSGWTEVTANVSNRGIKACEGRARQILGCSGISAEGRTKIEKILSSKPVIAPKEMIIPRSSRPSVLEAGRTMPILEAAEATGVEPGDILLALLHDSNEERRAKRASEMAIAGTPLVTLWPSSVPTSPKPATSSSKVPLRVTTLSNGGAE